MADIKTRDAVKGTIKTIDKAAIASERMKAAYAKTKDKAEQGYYADESSATEYASDKVSYTAERVTEEGVHQFNKQGKKGVQTTKENIVKAKDGIADFKTKRAMKSAEKRASNVHTQTVRTKTQAEKTIKQSARSTGKTIKFTTKGTVKSAEKSVKTAQSTSKAAIKTAEHTAKTAQKTSSTGSESNSKSYRPRRKGCSESDHCGGQGDYCRNKGIDFCDCRRRLGCRCDYYCYLPCRFACRFGVRYFLFWRGLWKRYDNANCCERNQYRVRCQT